MHPLAHALPHSSNPHSSPPPFTNPRTTASPWCPSLAPPLHPHRSSSPDHGLCYPPGRPAPGQAALGLCRHPRGPLVRPLPLARSVLSSPHPVSRAHPHHPWPRVICSLEPFEQAIQHRSVVLSLLDPPPLQLTLSRSLARSTDVYKKWRSTIDAHEGGLEQFSRGYEHFGLHQLKNGDIRYREWAPNATAAALTGDFSASSSSLSLSLSPAGADADPLHPLADGWNREANQMKKDSFGVWECVVPAVAGKPAIPHNSKIKVRLALSLDISFALGLTDSSSCRSR